MTVGAAGAVAGLYARIDGSAAWKAPAGTGGRFRGVSGVDLNLTDGEAGRSTRSASMESASGRKASCHGARTNDGADMFASEYKYIPIRRLALFWKRASISA